MTAYTVMENYKHGQLSVFLLLYIITIAFTALLITIIHQNIELHQPMNVLVSETHKIPVKWWMAQVFFLHTYANAEFCALAVMGYDRYAAICRPLHYHSIMSNSKTGKLVALHPCVNMELVKNSCSNAAYKSIVGILHILFLVVPQVVLIVSSYA